MTEIEIYNNLMGIRNAKGSNVKKELIKLMLEDADFVLFLQLALDADRAYGMSGLDPYEDPECACPYETLVTRLDSVSKIGGIRGDQAKAIMHKAACSSPERYELVNMIIKGELNIGLGAKVINQIKPHTIFRMPYQQCTSGSDEKKLAKVKFPAYVQEKADGQFAYIFINDHPRSGEPFVSRNGSGYRLFGKIVGHIISRTNKVPIGEFRVMGDDGVFLDRQTSNGIMDKFIDGTGTEEEAAKVHYTLWDLVPLENILNSTPYKVPYEERFQEVQTLFGNLEDFNIGIIETEIVNSLDEAQLFFKRMRAEGKEGAVLKDFKATWADNKSPLQIKMKNSGEGEMRIIDVNVSESHSYKGLLKSFVCATDDGQIVCDIGSGITKEMKEKGMEWAEGCIGKILTAGFTTVIADKTDRATYSLENPRLIETRFNEKNETDDLAYFLEQC